MSAAIYGRRANFAAAVAKVTVIRTRVLAARRASNAKWTDRIFRADVRATIAAIQLAELNSIRFGCERTSSIR